MENLSGRNTPECSRRKVHVQSVQGIQKLYNIFLLTIPRIDLVVAERDAGLQPLFTQTVNIHHIINSASVMLI